MSKKAQTCLLRLPAVVPYAELTRDRILRITECPRVTIVPDRDAQRLISEAADKPMGAEFCRSDSKHREDALVRCRLLAYYMEEIKPLRLHYKLPSKQPVVVQPRPPPTTSVTVVSNSRPIETKEKVENSLTKRKYVFKNASSGSGVVVGNGSVGLGALGPASNFFVLDSECSCYVIGEGPVHTRVVDLNSPLFCLEHSRREERKRLLRAELSELAVALEQLTEKADSREKGSETRGKRSHGGSVMKAFTGTSERERTNGWDVADGTSEDGLKQCSMDGDEQVNKKSKVVHTSNLIC